jgi:GTPase SAR1 family protein
MSGPKRTLNVTVVGDGAVGKTSLLLTREAGEFRDLPYMTYAGGVSLGAKTSTGEEVRD